MSKKFKNVIAGSKLKLSYHSLNKLSKVIKVHKDLFLNSQKKNVVYKISCKDCDASYVEQTGRLLKTRISVTFDGTRQRYPLLRIIGNITITIFIEIMSRCRSGCGEILS